MWEGGCKQSHLGFEHGLKLFWQRCPYVNTSSLIFKALKRKRMKPLTENAEQKNSDSHIYFVTLRANRFLDGVHFRGDCVTGFVTWRFPAFM